MIHKMLRKYAIVMFTLCMIVMVLSGCSTQKLHLVGDWILETQENEEDYSDVYINMLRIQQEKTNLSIHMAYVYKNFKQGEVLMSMKDERLELKITVDDPALFEFKKSNDKSYDYDIEGEWELYSVQSLDPENSLDELEDNDIGAIVEVEEDYIEVFLIYNKVKQRFFKIELNDNDILLYFTENDPQKFSKTDLSKKLILKEDKVNIELGESFSKNIEDYVDDTFMNTHDISKIKLDTSDVEMMKEKDYPKAGSYDLKFMYDDQEVVCRLFVEDTVKPKFVKTVDSIEVIQGNELEEKEVLKNFEATDLDEVTLEFNDFNVNYDKPDTYTAKVYAEDTSNNMQSIEVQIVVKKDPSIKEITKKEAYKIAYNSNHYKKLLEKYPEDADKRIMFFEPVEMEREGMKGFDIEVRIDNPAAGEGVTNYVIGYFVTLDGTLYYEDRLKQDKLFETD